MTYDLRELTATVIAETYGIDMVPVFSRPAPEHGDFSTNVAMQLARQLEKPHRQIAEEISEVLKSRGNFKISIAGPGFINITLADEDLFAAAMQSTNLYKPLDGQVIVSEYSDPNPFKVLHAGHLYTSLVGDAISNILQAAGGEVHRVNFGGDVGLHAAKAIWAILQELGGEYPDKLSEISSVDKLTWVSQRYVAGNSAYEENESSQQEIIAINKRIYELHETGDKESAFARIYWTCRQWSYNGFEDLYVRLGMVPFEKYYPESTTTQLGLDTVKQGLTQNIFHESEGAIVYKGEHKGLHTRVFINSAGLPTYETKDLGLLLTKWQEYKYDQSIIITSSEQNEYMKVVFSAAGEFNTDAASRTIHLPHGHVKMAGGMKMSSRKGNILTADDIMNSAFEASHESGRPVPGIVLGAIRYTFLRSKIGGGDIIYDPKESVSLEGNSGPYLQYSLVRARSIVRKITEVEPETRPIEAAGDLDQMERSLARQISIYPEAFAEALAEYSPHNICNYLYELAVTFNRFYEQSRVIGHERSDIRFALLLAYERTLSHGLSILGMPQPEQM